jgi:phospho-N-acetylmuramoyl-pentapeptide-transferase
MLYYIFYPLKEWWSGFNVFKYLTFRAAMASLMAFFICVVVGPRMIEWLRELKFGQPIREEHVKSLHEITKHKQGTPTMGGLIIILAVTISTLLWSDPLNKYILMTLGVFLGLGYIGFADDYSKVRKNHNAGLSARRKFFYQILVGISLGIFILAFTQIPTTIALPFLKNLVIELGFLYIFFVVLVITGSSNAVNLTDGLDGLATGCTIFVALAYAILSYLTGNYKVCEYLNIFFLPGGGELAVFCASLVGAGLGFLWFNSFPATVFMGDTGSLAIGGAIGTVAVLIKKELLLLIVGGIFVAEALSVILQVISVKTTGKRIFKCSPIHHHFQLMGWSESKITIRFWIIAIVLVLLSLTTLKLQ